MSPRLFTAVAPAFFVAGCTTMAGPVAGDMTPEDRAGYVTMAAASDLFKIQSSQMAVTRAQRPEVRQFAQMLVTHHTQTTATLMAAATASGMSPPAPALMPMQRQMIEELQEASTASSIRFTCASRCPPTRWRSRCTRITLRAATRPR